jgi:hypothetical protein
VHGSRLKFYHDASLRVTQEIRELVSAQGIEIGVEEIVGHRYNDEVRRWQLHIKWLGLQDEENSWESLDSMAEDQPRRVRDYANSTGARDLISKVESLLE